MREKIKWGGTNLDARLRGNLIDSGNSSCGTFELRLIKSNDIIIEVSLKVSPKKSEVLGNFPCERHSRDYCQKWLDRENGYLDHSL